MSDLLTTLGIIISLVLSGYIIQGIMKLIALIIKAILVVFSFFRIKIKVREKNAVVSENFRQVYKEIKRVKLSNKNLKLKSSIDWFSFGLMISSLALIIINLGVVSGNVISKTLYSIVAGLGIIPSVQDMNTLFTAIIFSVFSFSTTKVLQRWKETKQQRIEKKYAKIKKKAIDIMSSGEMIEAVKKKDEKKKKELQ